uniref:Nuclear hormone receptor HR96 n=1 Tax=Panagrolaimus superbus TaxID=310955 RepID=A0A914XRZ5_9BILA
MGVGLAPGHQFPTNFAGIGIASNAAQLSSSLPSTSNADGILPQDSQQSTQSNNIGIGPRKRTFSTSESQPAGDKRTATKICRVCGDKAYSYNFNVITCESCKAFFRRNANKEKDIRCPFNDQCDINIVSRRFCQRCRLQKCFRVGMKKEWIMSEEARMEKKQRILDNRERRAAERKSDDGPPALSSQQQQQQPQQSQHQQSHHHNHNHKISNGSSAAEELAAAINAASAQQVPILQQQQIPPSQPAAPTLATLLPTAATAFTSPPVLQQQSGPPQIPAPTEVAAQQLAAAVAAVAHQNPVAAAAVVAASQLPPQAFHPSIQNNPGQMATERALAASIVANASVPTTDYPTASSSLSAAAAHQQQQIVSQLVMQNQLQQQAVQQMAAVQQAAAAVQAQVQINHLQQQAHQQAHQQLAAAVVAAAASTMVPTEIQQQQQQNSMNYSNAPVPQTVVTVPSLQQQSQQVIPTTTVVTNDPSTDLVAVPRDVLIKLVEQKIESEQQAQQQAGGGMAPLKCQCHCSCGRYPSELLIVDKVMTDLLENSTKYNNSKPMGQLSPKSDQQTPPTLMSTTPPSFYSQTNPLQTLSGPSGVAYHHHHPQHQHQQHLQHHQICTPAATVGNGLPIPMEEDYVFKKSQSDAAKVLLNSKMEKCLVDPDCCMLTNSDIEILNELQNANTIWDTVLDKKDSERHAKPCHTKLDLVNMADGAIRRLVKMSKKIFVFRQLPYDDQMILIKYNHMGCLILRGALTYIEAENVWSGPSQKSNYNIKLETMKESKFDLMGSAVTFYVSMRKEWRTNESIIQILIAICLFDPSAANLLYHADVRLHNLRYHSILKRKLFMLCEKDQRKACQEYDLLMKNLVELKNLSYQAFKFVDEIRDCPLEPLVKELMLDLSSPS